MSAPPSRTFSLITAGAGAVIVLGVSQTWVTATSGIFTLQRSGFDMPDGKLQAWIGAGIVLSGLLAAFVKARFWLAVATLGGLGGVATGITDYRDVSGRGSPDITVSVGFGLYLCIVGAVLTVVFAILGLKADADAHGRPATFLPSAYPPPPTP